MGNVGVAGGARDRGESVTVPAKGQRASEEAKRKLSEAAKHRSADTRRKLSEAAKDRKHTEATKQKLSAARRGKKDGPLPEVTKQRISIAKRGRTLTEEHKQKISEALKGRKHDEVTKQKIGNALKGKKHSPERCAKLSKIFKGRPPARVRERMPEEERKRRANANTRRCRLRARYGLSIADYDALLIRQGGVCRICKLTCSTGKRLAVDHDHVTGEVRGLLCTRCNRGLGYFTLETLRTAFAYIEAYEQKRLISEPEIVLP